MFLRIVLNLIAHQDHYGIHEFKLNIPVCVSINWPKPIDE